MIFNYNCSNYSDPSINTANRRRCKFIQCIGKHKQKKSCQNSPGRYENTLENLVSELHCALFFFLYKKYSYLYKGKALNGLFVDNLSSCSFGGPVSFSKPSIHNYDSLVQIMNVVATNHVRIQRGTAGPDPPPPPPPRKITKSIWFLSNSGPDLLKNHEATEPAFDIGPSSARQRNAFKMAFRWRADDGPLIAVLPSLIKKILDLRMQNVLQEQSDMELFSLHIRFLSGWPTPANLSLVAAT